MINGDDAGAAPPTSTRMPGNDGRKLISVVTPCWNEAGNVREMATAVREVFAKLPQYRYEHIFIDNDSRDGTRGILRELCREDKRVKAIFNARNFGTIRSGVHVLLQTSGDAVIGLACDFQDPPEVLPRFLEAWEKGSLVVLGVKESVAERGLMRWARSGYYKLLGGIADAPVVPDATGFGLFDKRVVADVRRMGDPFPYFRGLLAEIGYPPALIPYHQPERRTGKSSYNLLSYIDHALVGITAHSRVPLRMATVAGLVLSVLSLLAGVGYLVAKLLFWDSFTLGLAPILVGFFLLTSVQLLFIGLLGEYIGIIFLHVRKRPHVFELERLNFDGDA
jgi:glycosyltransferase involved in cell wall biosynthesis